MLTAVEEFYKIVQREERCEIIEDIEELREGNAHHGTPRMGYNAALEDVINLIKARGI